MGNFCINGLTKVLEKVIQVNQFCRVKYRFIQVK